MSNKDSYYYYYLQIPADKNFKKTNTNISFYKTFTVPDAHTFWRFEMVKITDNFP